MVHTKTYILQYFYHQYLVLFTIVPRNSKMGSIMTAIIFIVCYACRKPSNYETKASNLFRNKQTNKKSEYTWYDFWDGPNTFLADKITRAVTPPWVWDRAIGLAHTACSTGSEFRIQNRVSPPGG